MEDGVESIEELVKNSSEDMSADRETEEQIQQGSDGAEEGKSGGVVKNLISAFVSRGGDVEGEGKSEDDRGSNLVEEASGGEGGGGGGIINSLISNIFHQCEGGDEEKKSNGGENEQVKAAEESGGGGSGGSVLDNIVSHLPKPISDGTSPGTEEASILIHSIVRD